MKDIKREQIIELAQKLGAITAEKNEAYGNATQVTGAILGLLYPNGIDISRYNDALITVRVLDKLMRIATRKDAFGENPWNDITGYGLLGSLNELVETDIREEKENSYSILSSPERLVETLEPKNSSIFNEIKRLWGWSMVEIPPGSATIGEKDDPNNALRQVTISRAFEMGKYPVTQELYAAVMQGANPSHFKGARLPVEQVSWEDALKFCDALSELAGFKPVYGGSGDPGKVDWNANGYRLPTDAEWEYACRADSKEPEECDLDKIAWHRENSAEETHPVGQKQANAWGLHDMLGNVWEWCWDWHSSSTPAGGTDPRGATAGYYRVLRGGSWNSSPHNLRVARRSSIVFCVSCETLGFRICRTL